VLLLIGLAAFMFMLWTVEFVVVRSQVMEIAGFYRSVGILYHEELFGDVSGAMGVIEGSSRVDFVDYRRIAEGVLWDFQNADFDGVGAGLPNLVRETQGFGIIYRRPETTFGTTAFHTMLQLAEGVLDTFDRINTFAASFRAEELMTGYARHSFRLFGSFMDGDEVFARILPLYHPIPIGAERTSHFADISWENRYFMRWFYAPFAGRA